MIPAITPVGQAAQRALGGWEQLYKEAVSDFPIHEDFSRFVKDVQAWMVQVNKEMEILSATLKTHTHIVTTSSGPTVSTPPLNMSSYKWGATSTVYVLPTYLNTSTIPPNIRGTKGYQYRPVITTVPTVPAYASVTTLTAGI
jgi:hypothetical protein